MGAAEEAARKAAEEAARKAAEEAARKDAEEASTSSWTSPRAKWTPPPRKVVEEAAVPSPPRATWTPPPRKVVEEAAVPSPVEMADRKPVQQAAIRKAAGGWGATKPAIPQHSGRGFGNPPDCVKTGKWSCNTDPRYSGMEGDSLLIPIIAVTLQNPMAGFLFAVSVL